MGNLNPTGHQHRPAKTSLGRTPSSLAVGGADLAGRAVEDELAGVGHMLGSLVEAAPDHAGTWFDGVWNLGDYPEMSDATVAWWYSVFSFGPPLLLIGLTVLWLDRRGMTPPLFISWAMVAWVVVGFVVDGPSPSRWGLER
ncbi:DUF6463 family protein [Streptomyces regalis]